MNATPQPFSLVRPWTPEAVLPLTCVSTTRTVPPVTLLFILACCGVYGLQDTALATARGLVPLDLTHALLHPGPQLPRQLASIVVAFFMHATLLHLLSNMWFF